MQFPGLCSNSVLGRLCLRNPLVGVDCWVMRSLGTGVGQVSGKVGHEQVSKYCVDSRRVGGRAEGMFGALRELVSVEESCEMRLGR